jgi:hypothetical protein
MTPTLLYIKITLLHESTLVEQGIVEACLSRLSIATAIAIEKQWWLISLSLTAD